MVAEYLIKYGCVNEFGQINVKMVLDKCNEFYNYRLYRLSEKLIDELYEVYSGTKYDGINNDLFVMGFDDECEMFLLIGKISNKLHKIKWN